MFVFVLHVLEVVGVGAEGFVAQTTGHRAFYTGVYKVPYSSHMGNLSGLLGKNIKLWRRGGNIMAVGKIIT